MYIFIKKIFNYKKKKKNIIIDLATIESSPISNLYSFSILWYQKRVIDFSYIIFVSHYILAWIFFRSYKFILTYENNIWFFLLLEFKKEIESYYFTVSIWIEVQWVW